MCDGRAASWYGRHSVRRGVARQPRLVGTSCPPSACLIFINILKWVGIGRSVCWPCSVLVHAACCLSWCHTAPPARGNLLLAFGSFNFYKHLEGGHRSKCVLVVQRVVRRGVTRRLWHEGTSCSPSARLVFINIFKGGHQSKCVLVVRHVGLCGELSIVVSHGASGAREPPARLWLV